MSFRSARLAAFVLTACVLAMAPGCLGGTHRTPASPAQPAISAPASPAADPGRADPRAADPGAADPRAAGTALGLTEAQARAALVTEADLGVPWAPSEGIAVWRDALLKATTTSPDCQRLLDALYADELLGEPSGTYAVSVLDDADDQAQLRYQVAAQRRADADRTLAWLGTLPQSCAQFTAATTRYGVQAVQVSAAELPTVGDARQGLRITLTGQTSTTGNGQPAVLTVDIAVVGLGDDAIVLTDGALGTPPPDAVRQALEVGTQRLTQVREQGRAQA